MTISKKNRREVYKRANDCCEYCRLPEKAGTVSFHIDHIIPVKHKGTDELKNLCLACFKCNGYKSSDIAGFDPQTGALSRLFDPRNQNWKDHFEIAQDSTLIGLTTEGRTTIEVLQINEESRVEHRTVLTQLKIYPCQLQNNE